MVDLLDHHVVECNSKTRGQYDSQEWLLLILMLFGVVTATAEQFEAVRWTSGITCTHCMERDVSTPL